MDGMRVLVLMSDGDIGDVGKTTGFPPTGSACFRPLMLRMDTARVPVRALARVYGEALMGDIPDTARDDEDEWEFAGAAFLIVYRPQPGVLLFNAEAACLLETLNGLCDADRLHSDWHKPRWRRANFFCASTGDARGCIAFDYFWMALYYYVESTGRVPKGIRAPWPHATACALHARYWFPTEVLRDFVQCAPNALALLRVVAKNDYAHAPSLVCWTGSGEVTFVHVKSADVEMPTARTELMRALRAEHAAVWCASVVLGAEFDSVEV